MFGAFDDREKHNPKIKVIAIPLSVDRKDLSRRLVKKAMDGDPESMVIIWEEWLPSKDTPYFERMEDYEDSDIVFDPMIIKVCSKLRDDHRYRKWATLSLKDISGVDIGNHRQYQVSAQGFADYLRTVANDIRERGSEHLDMLGLIEGILEHRITVVVDSNGKLKELVPQREGEVIPLKLMNTLFLFFDVYRASVKEAQNNLIEACWEKVWNYRFEA